jgi:hypothetical protein
MPYRRAQHTPGSARVAIQKPTQWRGSPRGEGHGEPLPDAPLRGKLQCVRGGLHESKGAT